MTHDEIIEWIDDELATSDGGQFFSSRMSSYRACLLSMRSVVELHKPDKEGLCAMNCVVVDDDGYAWTQCVYPCPTIEAIEKELG